MVKRVLGKNVKNTPTRLSEAMTGNSSSKIPEGLSREIRKLEIRLDDFLKDSSSKWMNAPPINAPHEKPTRAIKMRLRKASFRPINRMPIREIKLTTVTDARIAIRSAVYFNLTPFLLLYY
ncbi:MAG: hypothetical protein ACUVQX_03140 [Candidatus Bathycorpusculaceae bacterium]